MIMALPGHLLQWFIYNSIPMRPRTCLGYIEWVLLENPCIHYRIFHYNFVSPGTRWDSLRFKMWVPKQKCEYGTRDVQVQKITASNTIATHNIFLVSPWKHMLWVLIRSTHNMCFRGEIKKISTLFSWKKRPICCYVIHVLLCFIHAKCSIFIMTIGDN